MMHFVDNVARFREGFFQAMIEADKEDPQSEHIYKPWSCGGAHFSHRVVDLGPAKEFRDPPLSSVDAVHAAFKDLCLLVLYNGLLFLVIFWCFARQDVTPAPGV